MSISVLDTNLEVSQRCEVCQRAEQWGLAEFSLGNKGLCETHAIQILGARPQQLAEIVRGLLRTIEKLRNL